MDHNIDDSSASRNIRIAQPTPLARALAAMSSQQQPVQQSSHYTPTPHESTIEHQQWVHGATSVDETLRMRENDYERHIIQQQQEMEALRLELTQQQQGHQQEVLLMQTNMHSLVEQLTRQNSSPASPLILTSNPPPLPQQQSEIASIENRIMNQLNARDNQLREQLLEQNRQATQALENMMRQMNQQVGRLQQKKIEEEKPI